MTSDQLKRDQLIYRDLSDIQMANKVRTLFRDTIEHETVVRGARDRIMWLSQENERKQETITAMSGVLKHVGICAGVAEGDVPALIAWAERNKHEPPPNDSELDYLDIPAFLRRQDD